MSLSTEPSTTTAVLSPEDVAAFHGRGFLRIPAVFTPEETAELAEELDWMLEAWSARTEWTGGWRHELMTPEVERAAKIDVLHDLQHFSGAWARAVAKPPLAGALSDLLGGGPVELHHS